MPGSTHSLCADDLSLCALITVPACSTTNTGGSFSTAFTIPLAIQTQVCLSPPSPGHLSPTPKGTLLSFILELEWTVE